MRKNSLCSKNILQRGNEVVEIKREGTLMYDVGYHDFLDLRLLPSSI